MCHIFGILLSIVNSYCEDVCILTGNRCIYDLNIYLRTPGCTLTKASIYLFFFDLKCLVDLFFFLKEILCLMKWLVIKVTFVVHVLEEIYNTVYYFF